MENQLGSKDAIKSALEDKISKIQGHSDAVAADETNSEDEAVIDKVKDRIK